MKKFYHIVTWTILLIAIPACQRLTQYPLTIRQAETLMNIRPDSSLHLLQGMADSIPMLPEETQMYYHLLNIQAKDKLYITHTDDSLVNRIVEFYEEQGNKDRLMMAYFYQGSTYRDMNDAPRALKAFHSAVNQKEENKESPKIKEEKKEKEPEAEPEVQEVLTEEVKAEEVNVPEEKEEEIKKSLDEIYDEMKKQGYSAKLSKPK